MAERKGCLPKFLERFATKDTNPETGKWRYSPGELDNNDPTLSQSYYIERNGQRLEVFPNGIIHTWKIDKYGGIIPTSMEEVYNIYKVDNISLETAWETELVTDLLSRLN
jgi:hypothetical protein